MESMAECTYMPSDKVKNYKKRKEKKDKKKDKEGDKEKEEDKKEDSPRLELCHSDIEMDVDESEMHAFDSKAGKAKFKKGKQKYQVDTNVLQINLNVLNKPSKISSGDPIQCKHCNAYFNMFSVVKPIEGKKERQWTCEFCSNYNEISIESEEIPKEDSLTYVIEKIKVEEKKTDKIAEPIIVFCLDISASMDRIDKTSKNTASRLDCVKLTIQNQLRELRDTIPKAKVGFVTFENKVHILGNTAQSSLYELDEASYDSFVGMVERCIGKSDLINAPISESYDWMTTQLLGIKTGGATALGPGLTAAIALASRGSAGSKVIVCTDGKANRGIGKVESKVQTVIKASEEFYIQLGSYAKERGIVVSLISLVAEDCKMEMLAPVANMTGGDIVKVNPSMLEKDFKQFLSEKVFATNVQVKVRLHKVMEFRNVVEGKIEKDLLVIDIGNATESSKVSFEYKFKSSEELSKMEINLETLKETYFQTTIVYMTPDNFKCLKVQTKKHQITHEKEEAEAKIKPDILKDHARLVTCKIAEKGDYEDAMSHAVLYDKMAKGKGVKEEVEGLYAAMSEQQALDAPVMGTYKMAVNDDVTCMINKSKKKK